MEEFINFLCFIVIVCKQLLVPYKYTMLYKPTQACAHIDAHRDTHTVCVCVCVYVCVCVTHTYIHSYIHACMHVRIHTYVHTQLHIKHAYNINTLYYNMYTTYIRITHLSWLIHSKSLIFFTFSSTSLATTSLPCTCEYYNYQYHESVLSVFSMLLRMWNFSKDFQKERIF